METIDFNDFANESPIEEKPKSRTITDQELEILMDELQHPIKAQKEIAAKVKFYLDARIEKEMDENGQLSESTKKWVDTFGNLLEKLQKSIHGDKSVNLNVHAIGHGDIAKKIRDANAPPVVQITK